MRAPGVVQVASFIKRVLRHLFSRLAPSQPAEAAAAGGGGAAGAASALDKSPAPGQATEWPGGEPDAGATGSSEDGAAAAAEAQRAAKLEYKVTAAAVMTRHVLASLRWLHDLLEMDSSRRSGIVLCGAWAARKRCTECGDGARAGEVGVRAAAVSGVAVLEECPHCCRCARRVRLAGAPPAKNS